jgi:hypothetical protein
MSDKRNYEPIKYFFTPQEIIDLGDVLAREWSHNEDLQRQKALAAAEFTAQMKAADAKCSEIASKIVDGYELRSVECMILLETPRPGMKRIVRIDTNQVVREEAMTVQEMQSSFGFSERDEGETS